MQIDEIIDAVDNLIAHYNENPAEGMPEKEPDETPDDFLGRMQDWQRSQASKKGSAMELQEALGGFKRAHT